MGCAYEVASRKHKQKQQIKQQQQHQQNQVQGNLSRNNNKSNRHHHQQQQQQQQQQQREQEEQKVIKANIAEFGSGKRNSKQTNQGYNVSNGRKCMKKLNKDITFKDNYLYQENHKIPTPTTAIATSTTTTTTTTTRTERRLTSVSKEANLLKAIPQVLFQEFYANENENSKKDEVKEATTTALLQVYKSQQQHQQQQQQQDQGEDDKQRIAHKDEKNINGLPNIYRRSNISEIFPSHQHIEEDVEIIDSTNNSQINCANCPINDNKISNNSKDSNCNVNKEGLLGQQICLSSKINTTTSLVCFEGTETHCQHPHQHQQQQKQKQKNQSIGECDELQQPQQPQQEHQQKYATCPQKRQQQPEQKQCGNGIATRARSNVAATLAAACICCSFNSIHEILLHARTALATRLTIVGNVLSENFRVHASSTTIMPTRMTMKQQQMQPQHRQEKPLQSNRKQQQKHHQQLQLQQQQQKQEEQLHGALSSLPHQLLIVTSNKNNTNTNANSHTNSKLNTNQKINAKTKSGATLSEVTGTTNLPALAIVPNAIANALSATATATTSAAYNYFGHNHTSNNNTGNYSNSLRNSFSFYAASSVILVLCYLTTTTSAAAMNSDAAPVEKHPIQGIDWSKFDESSSDKEILDLLLEKKRYDKRLLPPVNDEDFCCGLQRPDMAQNQNARRPHKRGTLTVNVNVLLLSLASPDESSLKYEVEFLLNQQWNDPRLQYGNKSHYDFLNALHHHDSIWTPDTYFIMHGDFKDPIIPMHFALRIYRNGTITYAMRRHLILSCQGSLHIFPFDDPKCSFSMESISYEEAQIKYVWKNDEDTLRKSPSLTTLNAYLIKNQTTACDQNSWRGNYSCLRVDLIFTRDRAFYFTTVFIPGIILVTSSFITFWLEWNAVPARSMIGNYSCLQVELTFTRDRAYYFTTVFIPGIILVTSSFITFWLEWNAVPARVMIGVTTMLNFFTTSNGFRSTLPVVSNLTAMNVWDGVCMCFIYASLLEFVCVNYVGRKRPLHNVVYRPGENPVTQRLPAVLSRIGVILASPLASAATTPPASTATPGTPLTQEPMHQTPLTRVGFTSGMRWEEAHGGIIGAAVQHLRARSIKRKSADTKPETGTQLSPIQTQSAAGTLSEPVYAEPDESIMTGQAVAKQQPMQVTFKNVDNKMNDDDMENVATTSGVQLRRSRSMATNTPPLIIRGENEIGNGANVVAPTTDASVVSIELQVPINESSFQDIELTERQLMPLKPPRKKLSRSNSPTALYDGLTPQNTPGGTTTESSLILTPSNLAQSIAFTGIGEKRRDAGAPNEIVTCTTCGSSNSPCTHSANNGCATETCFVQVRKKEPPHPIRVAKTIDVIARITFPTAYSIFLIFFFVHYKGFS